MQALGLIETKGLLAAIECADAMLKAAEVHLLERTFVGGGLVTITIEGDVAATKAAVDAGGAAVRQLDRSLLISEHVIPRPHEDLDHVINGGKKTDLEFAEETVEAETDIEEIAEEETVEAETIAEETVSEETMHTEELHKEAVDRMVLEEGLDAALKMLNEMKVVKLRSLAREYKDFGITGRLISKADKKIILTEFKKYYKKN